MRELFRTFPLMCLVLLIPVIPFLWFGDRFESAVERFIASEPGPATTAATIVLLLGTDILLPIPSSVVSTLGGWRLGWLGGTLATWTGMTLGAILGFALARRWGRPFAVWFSRADDLQKMHALNEQLGPWVIVLTRAVPVLAEASVLMAGIHRMSWWRFLVPVVASNLGIAIGYAALGDVAERFQWLPLALGVAVAIPILVAAIAGRMLPRPAANPRGRKDPNEKFHPRG